MIYLDYSATTPTNDSVLETFVKCSKDFIGNPNSLHELGVKSKNMIDKATSQIANLLGVKESEIIYTSGASESNNLAIKGICEKYKNRGKHVITTPLEHSSIYGPIDYLKENGFKIDIIQTPKEISYGGCTYGARCNCEDIAGLLVLCKRNNIGYSRVFREELFENGKKSYRQIN